MSESKCQTCFNFDCSWHEHFKPVDGWTATPTTINGEDGKRPISSYKVIYCPLYKDRGRGIMPIKKSELENVLRIGRINTPKQFDRAVKLCRRIGYELVKEKNENGQKRKDYFLIPIGAEQ